MSAVNEGTQSITFDFRQEATSINFNRYSANLVKPGIYKGGRVSFVQYQFQGNTQYEYRVEPFSAAFLTTETDFNTKLLVNVFTTTYARFSSQLPTDAGSLPSGVPPLNQDYYLIASLDWIKTVNNYIDFRILPDISVLKTNELILCRIRGKGVGKKPEIYYDATTFGSFYESYDDKFTTYGTNSLSSNVNFGEYITSPSSPRKLLPFTSNSYYLKLDGYQNGGNFHYITFQPFTGEIELINKNSYREKIKFIFNTDRDINVISTAKTNIVNSSSNLSNYISFNVDVNGRLSIINGYTSAREYIIKSDIVNTSRKLNTVGSLA